MSCPAHYNDLVSSSNYCFRIVTEKETWETARKKCQKDGGELACFSNEQERNYLANQCRKCWVGYTWQNGKFSSVLYCSETTKHISHCF